MALKLTRKEVNKRLDNIGLILLSKYNGMRFKHTIKCICNKRFEVELTSLLEGRVKSCGCLLDKKGKNSFHWKGFGEISSSIFNKIKVTAKERNLSFNITIQQAWDLFLKQERKCALSGVELRFGDTHDDFKNRT